MFISSPLCMFSLLLVALSSDSSDSSFRPALQLYKWPLNSHIKNSFWQPLQVCFTLTVFWVWMDLVDKLCWIGRMYIFDWAPKFAFNSFTDHWQEINDNCLQFDRHWSSSNPPPSRSCGNPNVSFSSLRLADKIFSATCSSLSLRCSLIFFKPNPALWSICFVLALGILDWFLSAKQKNWAVQVLLAATVAFLFVDKFLE